MPIRISLEGIDSLLSIVQMPFGVPVATVAINGSKNAAILACQILAISDEELSSKLRKYREDTEHKVLQGSRDVERKN